MDNRMEEALKCLEAIPRATADPTSTPPKVAYAIARLSSALQTHKQGSSSRSTSSTATAMSSKVAQHLKSVVDAVPDALWSRSRLVEAGHDSAAVMPDDEGRLGDETRAWFEAKRLQSQKRWRRAAEVLSSLPHPTAASLRSVLESAHCYRTAGEKRLALAAYQRAHLMDMSSRVGMDALAALLAQVGEAVDECKLESNETRYQMVIA